MELMKKVGNIYHSKFEGKEVAVYGVKSSNGLTACELLSKAFITIGHSMHVYIDTPLNELCEMTTTVPIFAELCKLVGRGEWNTEGKDIVIRGVKIPYRGIFTFKSENGLDNVMKDKGLSVIKDDNNTPIVLFKDNLIIPLVTMHYNVRRMPNNEQDTQIKVANKFIESLLLMLGLELNPSSELDMISYTISERVKVKRMKRLSDEVESHKRNVENARKTLGLEIINLNNKTAMIRGLEENNKPIKFSPNDKVKDIQFEGDSLHVKTSFLYFRASNGGRYALGEMEIVFNIETQDVKFFNLTDKRRSIWGRDCQHPHVSGRGEGCLGNASEAIAMFASSYEYSALIDVLIAYLESSNLDDSAGKYTMNWDRVDEEGNVIWEGAVDYDTDKFVYDKRNCANDYIKGRKKISCACCDRETTEDKVKYVSGEPVCVVCLEENYTFCQTCDEFELKEKVFVRYDGYNICEECIQNRGMVQLYNGRYAEASDVYFCATCGKYYESKDYSMEKLMCGNCISQKVVDALPSGEELAVKAMPEFEFNPFNAPQFEDEEDEELDEEDYEEEDESEDEE